MKHGLLCLALFLSSTSLLRAQVFDEQFDAWPVKTRIGGTLVIADRLEDVSILRNAVRIPATGSTITLLVDDRVSAGTVQALVKTLDIETITVEGYLATKDFTKGLQKATTDSNILFWLTPEKLTEEETGQWRSASTVIQPYLDGGGKVVLLGAVAAFAGKFADQGAGKFQPGLNLLPEAILQPSTSTNEKRMVENLSRNARTVGVSLKPNTALIVGGRIARVLGTGAATFTLPAAEFHEVRTQTIKEADRRQRPPTYLVDWTEWRRDSIDRTLPQFPPAKPKPPLVEKGTLLIVGGGGMPRGLMDRFVELAGGAENAKLVYVPCSESLELSRNQGMVSAWKRMGVKSATFIHTKDRNKANTDQKFLAPLKEATGIWFGGGRQWNMADSYYGTEAHRLMKQVLSRGGVIGGSSAGASIQARYLARATPIENFRIMAPGYERGGLGFISGVAIDQHFSQRGRQKDMTRLVDRYPQMLGIGLDEATAIEVQQSVAKVTGRGKVFFYDRNVAAAEGTPDYVSLPSGGVYDLSLRRVVVDATKSEPASDGQDERADDQ